MDKIHGGVASGESVTKDMQFVTVKTLVPLEEGNVNTGTPTAKDNLERLVQFLQQRGQHVLRSLTSEVVADPSAVGFGTDFAVPATVYTYSFAVEHASSMTAAQIADAIDGLKVAAVGVDFDTSSVTLKNTLVSKREVL